jgi:hypothetical protein
VSSAADDDISVQNQQWLHMIIQHPIIRSISICYLARTRPTRTVLATSTVLLILFTDVSKYVHTSKHIKEWFDEFFFLL